MTIPSPIDISTHYASDCDATHMEWISDDGQGWMDGGPLDPARSFEEQATAWALEMQRAGHDCTGTIRLCYR